MKRPLAMGCLILCVLLRVLLLLIPTKEMPIPGNVGEKLLLTGRVLQKEVYEKEGKEIVLVTLLPIHEKKWKVICYLNEKLPNNENISQGISRATLQEPNKAGLTETDKTRMWESNKANIQDAVPKIGSIIKVSGTIRTFDKATNQGQFDTYSYYKTLHISCNLKDVDVLEESAQYSKTKEFLWKCRWKAGNKLDRMLPDVYASLLKTMILGDRKSLDSEMKDLYQRNGLAHILAISGLHVSLLGLSIYKIFRKMYVPIPIATFLSSMILIFYGMMTGFSVSSLRAIIMFAISMIGIISKRTYDMLTAAALTAAIVCISEPLYLINSAFLFSFSCILGICVIFPAISESDFSKKKSLYLKKILTGPSIFLATLPCQLWFYYQIPLYSIFLNLLILPFMSTLMGAGVLVILLPGKPASLPAMIVSGLLLLVEKVIWLFEHIPGHLITMGRPDSWQIILYLVALFVMVLLRKKAAFSTRLLLVLLGICILIPRFRPKLQVDFLDVGQGDCIYVCSEGKYRYLIDGGSSSVKQVGQYRILPFLKYQGASQIDAVFVTHPDADHMNGILELLESFEEQGIGLERVVLPAVLKNEFENFCADNTCDNRNLSKLFQLSKDNEIEILFIEAGMKVERGNLKITCLNPDERKSFSNENAYSTVLLLEYEGFSCLLTGDVEGEGELQMMERYKKYFQLDSEYSEDNQESYQEDTKLDTNRQFYQEDAKLDTNRLTLLKVAHHGSANSTGDVFLDIVQPQYAIISCGKKNRYGHPHKDTMERLSKYITDMNVLRTDEFGQITVKIKNGQLYLEKYNLGK